MMNTLSAAILAAVALGAGSVAAQADEVAVTVHRVTADGIGAEVGTVTFEDHEYGLLIVPDLHDLTSGPHAAHIHENPNCGPTTKDGEAVPAGAAGGHFDPEETGRHEGPYGTGHLGDLPNLIVEQDGSATIPVLAPPLDVAAVHGRALMIHAGADRYTHHGAHIHGKGGMRMYCGVIE